MTIEQNSAQADWDDQHRSVQILNTTLQPRQVVFQVNLPAGFTDHECAELICVSLRMAADRAAYQEYKEACLNLAEQFDEISAKMYHS